jgi:predicted nucleic acid-binding protein
MPPMTAAAITVVDHLDIALAIERDCRFVTADGRFLRKLALGDPRRFRDRVIALTDAL